MKTLAILILLTTYHSIESFNAEPRINNTYNINTLSTISFINNSIIQDAGQCTLIANTFAKKYLNYPSESSFSYGSVHESNTVENTATVLNKFTAKNAYGVKKSYVYKIKIRYKGGNPDSINNWECESIIIEEEGGKQIVNLSEQKRNASPTTTGKPISAKLNNGIIVTLYERRERYARIRSKTKLTKEQCIDAVNALKTSYSSVVYFHLTTSTERGKEYGQLINGEIILF